MTGVDGMGVLEAFGDELGVDDLRRLLAGSWQGSDAASVRLRAAVGDGGVDLGRRADRLALLDWLRSWGCRHLRVADTGRSSAALARWWRRFGEGLPSGSLVTLGEGDLAWVALAYGVLASSVVAARTRADGVEVAVTLGDTAAAKALYAMRPRAFPPWDEPIRLAFGRTRCDGALYAAYLRACAGALVGCAGRFGVAVEELPGLLGSTATPARLIDEYLWLRVTRGAGA